MKKSKKKELLLMLLKNNPSVHKIRKMTNKMIRELTKSIALQCENGGKKYEKR